jgi:hypothetical protein
MKTTPATKYTCDFCGKAMYAAGPMATHEKHCTMNPARHCRMDHEHVDLADLIAMIPDAEQFRTEDVDALPHDHIRYEDPPGSPPWGYRVPPGTYEDAVERIQAACDECPLCTFAALRQSGVPMYLVKFFKLKDELAAWWSAVNESQRDEGWY